MDNLFEKIKSAETVAAKSIDDAKLGIEKSMEQLELEFTGKQKQLKIDMDKMIASAIELGEKEAKIEIVKIDAEMSDRLTTVQKTYESNAPKASTLIIEGFGQWQ